MNQYSVTWKCTCVSCKCTLQILQQPQKKAKRSVTYAKRGTYAKKENELILNVQLKSEEKEKE